MPVISLACRSQRLYHPPFPPDRWRSHCTGSPSALTTATAPALHDIWLDIPAGALVAVTGPVGAGKSALARALLGLYPLEAGQVLLDGRPLERHAGGRAHCPDWISSPGPLPLFWHHPRQHLAGSGHPASRCRTTPPAAAGLPVLAAAVSCAALGEDLRTFPAGLETEIGELGIRVSGGQRQRIALARAMVTSGTLAPGLLVLDDPFSALDLDTEARIVAGLRQLFGPLQPYAQQCTVVLFSHRLLAFPQADLVVVLDRGRILEQGTHAELSTGNGLYARIYRAQRLASTEGVTQGTPVNSTTTSTTIRSKVVLP